MSFGTRECPATSRVETNASHNMSGNIMDTRLEDKDRDHTDLSNVIDGSITAENQECFATAPSSVLVSESRPSGHSLARKINFRRISRRRLWGENADVFGLEYIYGPDEIREDFIKNIDRGAAFEFCKVCGKTHIPPGPPFTLPDRDTCGSYIPE